MAMARRLITDRLLDALLHCKFKSRLRIQPIFRRSPPGFPWGSRSMNRERSSLVLHDFAAEPAGSKCLGRRCERREKSCAQRQRRKSSAAGLRSKVVVVIHFV
jgi:hypothetical protein